MSHDVSSQREVDHFKLSFKYHEARARVIMLEVLEFELLPAHFSSLLPARLSPLLSLEITKEIT